MTESAGSGLTIRQRSRRLRRLARRLFTERSLLVASNRGPLTFQRGRSGTVRRKRGAGGVISAVSAISRYASPVWICTPVSSVDREMVGETPGDLVPFSTRDYDFRLRFVLADQESYDAYYSVISNPLLWFLQHYMWDVVRTPTFTPDMWSAWEGYRTVNHAFAQAIGEEVARSEKPSIIMLQDYHLYLCAGMLAPRLPRTCVISHFVHIPWPSPDYWAILPPVVREQIFSSLCSNDVLGFHTKQYALNYLRTCESLLHGSEVDYSRYTVEYRGKTLRVRAYPISIDLAALQRLSEARKTRRHLDHLRRHLGRQTIVRIDRIEPSKNIVRGFQAFNLLLERYPEHRGHVRFLAFLVPSRLGIEEYERYLEEIIVAAQWINLNYGDGEWQPVELFVGEDQARAVAAMRLYDVLLVNPIIDGMNLVAKEGPIMNERQGVLVLSEGAGASEELAEGALIVSPYDLVQTATSLHRALTMPQNERAQRAATLRRVIEGHTVEDWLYDQLLELSRIQPRTVKGQQQPPRQG